MTPISIPRCTVTLGALALALTLAAIAPAAAQMYPGEGVTVNPAATGGPRTLLYPDGKHIRTLPPLLQPGQTSSAPAPIHLHMPVKHRRTVRREEAPATTETEEQAPAPVTRHATVAPEAVAPEPPAPSASEPPAPAGRGAPAAIPFSFSGDTAAAPARTTPAKPAAKPVQTTVASARPLPEATPRRGETKQAAILFDDGDSVLTDSSNARLKDLASSLMTALASGADEVELVAYGGSPGDKSSAARRLSLKRALAVREGLILRGVPANRIDVRALGGVEDNGPTDRVDIFIKS